MTVKIQKNMLLVTVFSKISSGHLLSLTIMASILLCSLSQYKGNGVTEVVDYHLLECPLQSCLSHG